MNKEDNNKLTKEIILSQKDFELLPRDEDGICVYDGNLHCYNNQLTTLPNNLKINGNLDCSYNQLTILPDDLKINGNLHCECNQLTVLPINLMVGGYLNCRNNQLTSIPDDLYVRYNLYCDYNKITKEIKITIGGDVIMDNEQQKIYDRIIKLNKITFNL